MTNDTKKFIRWLTSPPAGPKRVEVTPEIAIEALTAYDEAAWENGSRMPQRPLSEVWARELGRRMVAGLFRETPEPLMFDTNLVCMNGQHRLHAIVSCGIPQTFWVHFGCDPTLFDVIDGGRKRSPADVFSVRGVTDASVASSITNALNRYHYSQGDEARLQTPYETFDYYIENVGDKRMTKAKRVYRKGATNKISGYSTMAGLYLVALDLDAEAAEDFFAKVTEGANLGVRSIEKKLRDHLMRNGTAQSREKTRADIVHAWNARRMGQRTFSTEAVGGQPRML